MAAPSEIEALRKVIEDLQLHNARLDREVVALRDAIRPVLAVLEAITPVAGYDEEMVEVVGDLKTALGEDDAERV